eukprot:Amastigsp_a4229_55.p3 type:complete len:154 gc:universal Amastigsp_a4229_55:582-121(-)
MEPAASTWLSFVMIIDDRSMRCVSTPPTSMPYFSTRRKPGVVFRVPATIPVNPVAALTSTNLRDMVAMPEQRARRLSATRSPLRRACAGPRTVAACFRSPGERENSSPSRTCHSIVHRKYPKTSFTKGTPATTPLCFMSRCATAASPPTTKPP